MDLSGKFKIALGYQKPQTIEVRKIGHSYLFSFLDQLERTIHVEGQSVGFEVTRFVSRDFFHLSSFVVFGEWEQLTYKDWRGRILPVEVLEREYSVSSLEIKF